MIIKEEQLSYKYIIKESLKIDLEDLVAFMPDLIGMNDTYSVDPYRIGVEIVAQDELPYFMNYN